MVSYAALDIETSNLDMEAEGLSFDNPKGWDISCICIVNEEGVSWTFTDSANLAQGDFPNLYPLSRFVEIFTKEIIPHHIILTHNGYRFDFPIIQEYLKREFNQVLPEYFEHFDSCDYLLAKTGVRYRLAHLVSYHLGLSESKLMDASNAPISWAEGKHHEVVEYCLHDCSLTIQMIKNALGMGHFNAIGKPEYAEVQFRGM